MSSTILNGYPRRKEKSPYEVRNELVLFGRFVPSPVLLRFASYGFGGFSGHPGKLGIMLQISHSGDSGCRSQGVLWTALVRRRTVSLVCADPVVREDEMGKRGDLGHMATNASLRGTDLAGF
jgi:hypothetical protein